MTPREFKEKMEEIIQTVGWDVEVAHGRADDLMCEVLRDVGYGEGVDVFNEMDKWYA